MKIVKLLDVANLERGTEPGSDSYCSISEGTRFLRVGDITGKGHQEIYTNSDNVKLAIENDVLMTFDGTPGFVNRGLKGAISSGIRKISPKDENILNREYLYYALQTNNVKRTILKYSSSQTIIHASKSIPYLEIPLPPLSEQKRIAEILGKVDNLRKKRQEADELMHDILSELFENLFVSSRSLPLVHLKKVVTRLTNGYVGPTRNIYKPKGIPYILARHIKDNRVTFDSKTYVSEEFNKKHAKSILAKDDVLLVQSGHIGEAAVVPEQHIGHNCHALIVISTIKDKLSGQFLAYFFKTKIGQDNIKRIQTGITLKHLNCHDVKNILIPLPPLYQQQKFADLVQKIELVREKQGQSREQIGNLLQSCMNKFLL